MQHIYMVRHGQSQANAHKIVSGSQESPLTQLGREQARLAGQKARTLSIDIIVCSPMSRARETAQIIADTIGYPRAHIITLEDLRERGLGDLEGTNYTHNLRMNGNYPETESVPGIEPLDLLHGRVQAVLRQLLADKNHTTALIVCHMNIARMLNVIVAGLPANSLYTVPRAHNGDLRLLI